MSRKILSEIWLYPIKSFPGVRVKSANVIGKGLQGDRRFMLIDENNDFITQRNVPQMALFDVSLDNDILRVRPRTHDKLGTLSIALTALRSSEKI